MGAQQFNNAEASQREEYLRAEIARLDTIVISLRDQVKRLQMMAHDLFDRYEDAIGQGIYTTVNYDGTLFSVRHGFMSTYEDAFTWLGIDGCSVKANEWTDAWDRKRAEIDTILNGK